MITVVVLKLTMCFSIFNIYLKDTEAAVPGETVATPLEKARINHPLQR